MATEQMQGQQVTVSIVILTWNSGRQIEACLASLAQGLSAFPSEVIVIDNDSQDETRAVIKKTWSNVQLVCNTENRGVAPARNQGIRLGYVENMLLSWMTTQLYSRGLWTASSAIWRTSLR